jgi:hypothetical protein
VRTGRYFYAYHDRWGSWNYCVVVGSQVDNFGGWTHSLSVVWVAMAADTEEEKVGPPEVSFSSIFAQLPASLFCKFAMSHSSTGWNRGPSLREERRQ